VKWGNDVSLPEKMVFSELCDSWGVCRWRDRRQALHIMFKGSKKVNMSESQVSEGMKSRNKDPNPVSPGGSEQRWSFGFSETWNHWKVLSRVIITLIF